MPARLISRTAEERDRLRSLRYLILERRWEIERLRAARRVLLKRATVRAGHREAERLQEERHATVRFPAPPPAPATLVILDLVTLQAVSEALTQYLDNVADTDEGPPPDEAERLKAAEALLDRVDAEIIRTLEPGEVDDHGRALR